MNTREIKGDWNTIKGQMKQRWENLTDEDLHYAVGQYDELLLRMQERTGESSAEIDQAIQDAGADAGPQ